VTDDGKDDGLDEIGGIDFDMENVLAVSDEFFDLSIDL
jgi:hypothetical protein